MSSKKKLIGNHPKDIFAIYTLTIVDGQSLSDAIDLDGAILVGIRMPALWTAANLTFQSDLVGTGTYQNVYDDQGSELVVIAAASLDIILDPGRFAPLRSLKLRSGTSGAPVTQSGANRTIKLYARPL